LSNAWNIPEKFVKNNQGISPKRVDIEKKDGGLFTKELQAGILCNGRSL
jgi:hypothetical protein